MKTFKKFISYIAEAVEAKDEEPIQPKIIKKEGPPKKLKKKDEWSKKDKSWVVNFHIADEKYSLILTPNDDTEEHWNFNYSKFGQKDTSDIGKFGPSEEWLVIWTKIFEILKEFIRLNHPMTMKFVGMSDSKRRLYYRELFKILSRRLRKYFTKKGYHSSFEKDINSSPSIVIKKGSDKKDEVKKDEEEK